MKTSIVLLALIFLNTFALLSEPIAGLVNGINPWFLVGVEIFLLLVLYLNYQLKELSQIAKIDFSGIEYMPTERKDKTQGKP
ncbi:hypothetical protein [Zobellia nedashkovskayae]|uniref:hypothetical protein n=1 Tax=Zobellia nedashkovskayae TaxID=2779510 RepID=UPI00188AF921|nr:hypothetical protein [Zobellia nedashkovskayae]